MTLEERVIKAKNDPSEMDALLKEYMPFIKASISKTLKKYIQSDDASLTTGMMGFHEAVEKYDSAKGGFLSYAQIVIRNRLIDEVRLENRQTMNTDLSLDSTEEGKAVSRVQDGYAIEMHENRELADQRKDDLTLYTEVLKGWDLTLTDLVAASPKKKELLTLFQSIGRHIADDKSLLEQLRTTKRLPASYILENFVIDRKRLDRGRKYIIAVVELWAGDFETLKSFVKGR